MISVHRAPYISSESNEQILIKFSIDSQLKIIGENLIVVEVFIKTPNFNQEQI